MNPQVKKKIEELEQTDWSKVNILTLYYPKVQLKGSIKKYDDPYFGEFKIIKRAKPFRKRISGKGRKLWCGYVLYRIHNIETNDSNTKETSV